MIKNDDEILWKWYQYVLKFENSGLPQKKFANQEGIEAIKLRNMIFRLKYKSKSNPKLYNKYIKIGRFYLASEEKNPSQFAKDNGIKRQVLNEIITHINYIDRIERIKKKREKENSMDFIEIPQLVSTPNATSEPEVVEKQNDLEITIAKGVRVSIAPNIEPMKIIKIIELLKDL